MYFEVESFELNCFSKQTKNVVKFANNVTFFMAFLRIVFFGDFSEELLRKKHIFNNITSTNVVET